MAWYNPSMRTCDVCGKEFKPARQTQHLCGLSCRGKWLNMVRPARQVRDVACAKCGAMTPSRGPGRTYCIDCRAPERSCAECSQPFRSRRPKAVYCSHSCASLVGARVRPPQPTGRDHANWTGGALQYRGPGWREISKTIRDRDGWLCQDCGRPFRGRQLAVHHLRPAAEWDRPGDANAPENLISLCRSCHSHRHVGYLPPNDVQEEQTKARRRAYYQAHREKSIANAATWNREHKEQRRETSRKRNERHAPIRAE